jgi:hypothetical protein
MTYGNEKCHIVESFKYLYIQLQILGRAFSTYLKETAVAAIRAMDVTNLGSL